MNKALQYILSIALCVISVTTVQGQNNNPPKNKTVVDMKEFDDNAFKDANAVTIRDSSILTQHLIGVKWGYGISNVGFSIDMAHKAIKSPANFGIYYTYYHSLWKSMPYFGLHTGIEFSEMGYVEITGKDPDIIETEYRYKAIDIPLMTQFRVDFWKMRIMLGIGAFGSYIVSTDVSGGVPSTTNRMGGGIIGGGGLAVKFHPLEIQIDCSYKYALSHFLNPQIYSTEHWVYTHANQMQISVGLFYNLSKKKRNK